MEQIELLVSAVVFFVTMAGLGCYLRSDARANRAILTELFRGEIGRLDQKIGAVEERLSQRIDAVESTLSAQMQANHRELLLRLAFHHHGDGR